MAGAPGNRSFVTGFETVLMKHYTPFFLRQASPENPDRRLVICRKPLCHFTYTVLPRAQDVLTQEAIMWTVSPFSPQNPSDHFGGSLDYPLATVSGRCQLLRLDKPHPENLLRSDIQGAMLIFASNWRGPSQCCSRVIPRPAKMRQFVAFGAVAS